jgi:hypothetical protein
MGRSSLCKADEEPKSGPDAVWLMPYEKSGEHYVI